MSISVYLLRGKVGMQGFSVVSVKNIIVFYVHSDSDVTCALRVSQKQHLPGLSLHE